MEIDVTSVSRRSEPVSGRRGGDHRDHRRGHPPLRRHQPARRAAARAPAWRSRSPTATPGRSARAASTPRTANKLLVLIDGRSIYTPLFSGVFWDVQDVMLEDIDRIEVIRGPGATLWGANAVNGVINIITKSAARHPGGAGHGSAAATEEEALASFRQGGKLGEGTAYRAYGKYSYRDSLAFAQRRQRPRPAAPGAGGVPPRPRRRRLRRLHPPGGRLSRARRTAGRARADTVLDGANLLGRWTPAPTRRIRLRPPGLLRLHPPPDPRLVRGAPPHARRRLPAPAAARRAAGAGLGSRLPGHPRRGGEQPGGGVPPGPA